jgi:2-oxoglutarate dehydrogenase E2 component (dihydrolipoamide succinyltransferase)
MPVDVRIPELGESITEAVIVQWLKADGDVVALDEPIAELETDKANAELPAPVAGQLRIVRAAGETVQVGDVIARIDEARASTGSGPQGARASEPDAPGTLPPMTGTEAGATSNTPTRMPTVTELAPSSSLAAPPVDTDGEAPAEPLLSPAARRLIEEHELDPLQILGSGRGGRVMKDDVLSHVDEPGDEGKSHLTAPDQNRRTPAPADPTSASTSEPARGRPGTDDDAEERVPMSPLRRRIATRLVDAQQTAAILTTFNEIDMSSAIDLRKRYKESFERAHGVSLGYMSLFARACVLALHEIPGVNARIDGDEIVYNRRVHLGIAASTERGLVVPVVRDADGASLAELEREIGRLATRARDGKLGIDELTGGTFTISNGGVFGSLMSTPILNPPQSGILGMHKIEKRPVVVDDDIVIRPMMYVALSYDHRLVDGREAVTFLVRVKERIEDPERMLLEV